MKARRKRDQSPVECLSADSAIEKWIEFLSHRYTGPVAVWQAQQCGGVKIPLEKKRSRNPCNTSRFRIKKEMAAMIGSLEA